MFVGDSKPVPTHGGLLEGVVKDADSAGYVKGAKVAGDTDAGKPAAGSAARSIAPAVTPTLPAAPRRMSTIRQLVAGRRYARRPMGFLLPWLSEDPTDLTLAPGASATVTVTLNAAAPSIAQPGVYTAAVTATTDTPYSVPNVAVNMTVTPPASWGKIAGTVTTVGKTGAAVPVPGATVELDGWAQTYTLTTDKDGKYGIWMDKRNNPITAIVADNGFKPQTARLKVVAGQTVTKNWVLVSK